eukprot:7248483-Lingulodinium_polyedra.AAC.1
MATTANLGPATTKTARRSCRATRCQPECMGKDALEAFCVCVLPPLCKPSAGAKLNASPGAGPRGSVLAQ